MRQVSKKREADQVSKPSSTSSAPPSNGFGVFTSAEAKWFQTKKEFIFKKLVNPLTGDVVEPKKIIALEKPELTLDRQTRKVMNAFFLSIHNVFYFADSSPIARMSFSDG